MKGNKKRGKDKEIIFIKQQAPIHSNHFLGIVGELQHHRCLSDVRMILREIKWLCQGHSY